MRPSPKRDHLLVGVTGGIGSGKSVVCDLFKQLGRVVISADLLARKLTDESPRIKADIQSTFGPEVFSSDGTIDRAKLADVVFSDKLLRKRLNEIIHPQVFESLHHHINSLSARQRTPYVVIEAALIYESGFDKQLDYVIVVDAEEGKRISRIVKRDGLNRKQVIQRMQAQIPTSKKVEMADFVIRNNGPISALRSTVIFLNSLLTQLISLQNQQ